MKRDHWSPKNHNNCSTWLPPLEGTPSRTFTKEEFLAMHPRSNFMYALDPHDGTQPSIKRVPDYDAIKLNEDSDDRESVFGMHWHYEYRRFRALYTYTCPWKALDIDKQYAKLRRKDNE